MKLLQPTSISSSIIEISIFSSIYRGRNSIPLFFTLYLEIAILEEYIGTYLISIIEFLYFRGENSKIHWRWSKWHSVFKWFCSLRILHLKAMMNPVDKKFGWVIKGFSSLQFEKCYSVPVLISDCKWYETYSLYVDLGDIIYSYSDSACWVLM